MKKLIVLRAAAARCVPGCGRQKSTARYGAQLSPRTTILPATIATITFAWVMTTIAPMFATKKSKTLANQALTITAEHNGGIQVTTWDKPEIEPEIVQADRHRR